MNCTKASPSRTVIISLGRHAIRGTSAVDPSACAGTRPTRAHSYANWYADPSTMGTSPEPSSSILALSTPIASSADSRCSQVMTPLSSSTAKRMERRRLSCASAAAAGILTSPESEPKSPGDSAALSCLALSSAARSAASSSSPLSMLRSCS